MSTFSLWLGQKFDDDVVISGLFGDAGILGQSLFDGDANVVLAQLDLEFLKSLPFCRQVTKSRRPNREKIQNQCDCACDVHRSNWPAQPNANPPNTYEQVDEVWSRKQHLVFPRTRSSFASRLLLNEIHVTCHARPADQLSPLPGPTLCTSSLTCHQNAHPQLLKWSETIISCVRRSLLGKPFVCRVVLSFQSGGMKKKWRPVSTLVRCGGKVECCHHLSESNTSGGNVEMTGNAFVRAE